MLLYEESVSSTGLTGSVSEEDSNFVTWPSMEELKDDSHSALEEREVRLQSEESLHDLETWD